MTTERRFYPPTVSDLPLHGWKPYSDLHLERIRAHAKHDDNGGSMERKPFDHPIWLAVVTEEVGEAAQVICDNQLGVLDGDYRQMLREELVQVGAMVSAWIDAIDLTQ